MNNFIIGWRVIKNNESKQHFYRYNYDGFPSQHCYKTLQIDNKKLLTITPKLKKCKVCEKEVMRLEKLGVVF